MKKILVPTDFSVQANDALEVAYHIAKKSGAQLLVMHVVEDATVNSVQYTGEVDLSHMEDRFFMMKLIQKAKADLAATVGNSAYVGVEIQSELRIGNPYHNIKDLISEQNVDLIVMGTTGSSGLEEFIMGSNAEKVVRHAKCPVLTIHKKATKFDYKDIVYATAMEDSEKYCLTMVNAIQKLYDAKLHLVRINTPNNFQSDRHSYKELRNYAEKCGLENYDVHVYNEASEEEGIMHFAESINADMIAMATHGRTGLAHLLTGSIAEDVVNHANRPVLTYVIDK